MIHCVQWVDHDINNTMISCRRTIWTNKYSYLYTEVYLCFIDIGVKHNCQNSCSRPLIWFNLSQFLYILHCATSVKQEVVAKVIRDFMGYNSVFRNWIITGLLDTLSETDTHLLTATLSKILNSKLREISCVHDINFTYPFITFCTGCVGIAAAAALCTKFQNVWTTSHGILLRLGVQWPRN